jgi:pimeloyl-ACP methyl ester carboxylesterase
MFRARWGVFARNCLFLVLGLCALSALTEHLLELHDAARLTAGDTFFVAQGRRIRYQLTDPSAPVPTLVLLNGMGASLEQWGRLKPALSTLMPVVSYDRIGAGFSDPAPEYDAVGGADELDQLLHAPHIAAPFVLVSYSSSAMMAIAFTARHRDAVKGIVFIDPILGSAAARHGKTYRRIFLRPGVVNPIEAFFGLMRLRLAIEDRNATSSPSSERTRAILVSTHHWLAMTHEAFSLDEAADEVASALATHPLADLPIAVLVTKSPVLRDFFEQQDDLAASSDRAVVRTVYSDHSQVVSDPEAIATIVELIHMIAGEARP